MKPCFVMLTEKQINEGRIAAQPMMVNVADIMRVMVDSKGEYLISLQSAAYDPVIMESPFEAYQKIYEALNADEPLRRA